MDLSDKHVQKFKGIYKKEYSKEISDAEAREAGENLVGLFDILWKMSIKDTERKLRLRKEPKGFPVDGHYNCAVCYRTIDPQTGWYDSNNQKCLSCQKAVEDGTLPSFVCHHRSSFFLTWELANTFGIKSPTAHKLVRQGKLVARIIKNEQYNSNEYIFLKKENRGLIERYNSIRKSYDRHRNKVNDARIREEKKKFREEIKQEKAKRSKKFQLN